LKEFAGTRTKKSATYLVGDVIVKSLPNRYNFEGVQVRADPNEVFMVFVNENKVAYLWYWHIADDDDKTLPLGHEKRFKKKVI